MICCLIISFVVYPLFKCFKSSVYLISLEEKNQGLHNEKEVDSTKPHILLLCNFWRHRQTGTLRLALNIMNYHGTLYSFTEFVFIFQLLSLQLHNFCSIF